MARPRLGDQDDQGAEQRAPDEVHHQRHAHAGDREVGQPPRDGAQAAADRHRQHHRKSRRARVRVDGFLAAHGVSVPASRGALVRSGGKDDQVRRERDLDAGPEDVAGDPAEGAPAPEQYSARGDAGTSTATAPGHPNSSPAATATSPGTPTPAAHGTLPATVAPRPLGRAEGIPCRQASGRTARLAATPRARAVAATAGSAPSRGPASAPIWSSSTSSRLTAPTGPRSPRCMTSRRRPASPWSRGRRRCRPARPGAAHRCRGPAPTPRGWR